VKRLASIHCSNNGANNSLQPTHDNLKSFSSQQKVKITNSNCHYQRERERNSDKKSIGEHDREKKLADVKAAAASGEDQHYINDTITISKSTRTEQIMGSNVSSSAKGLSGRRTQSQSEYDAGK
jgi:hypothetical protein